MGKIATYKADDGTLFETEKECNNYNVKLLFIKWYGKKIKTSEYRAFVDRYIVFDFLCDYKKDIQTFLNEVM